MHGTRLLSNPIGGVPAVPYNELAAPAAGAAAAALDSGFGYQGGPIIADPDVHVTFWGGEWQEAANAGHRTSLVQFIQDFLASSYMNILSQYGVGHGAGACGRYAGDTNFVPAQAAWLEVDNNPATVAIVGANDHLYQLHNTGKIWRYTGTPLTGWQELDNNPATVAIAAAGDHLYQLHNTGRIWRFTGTPLTGWQELDNNRATVAIVAANDHLYQLHNTGRIWRYTGTPLTGWQELDNNPATVAIVAANDHLYQRHNTGRIWRYTGTPLTGWQELDNNPATVAIVAANDHLYQRHNTGRIWRYTGTPLTGWQELDNNPATVEITAANDHLYQRHNTGKIWRYTGTPLTGWQELDEDAATVALAAAGDHLYQRHNTGTIWEYTGQGMSDGDIHTGIQTMIDRGLVPEPGAPSNMALVIFMDGSLEVNDSGVGVVMCEPQGDNAFGYHYYFTTHAGHRFYYSVVPWLDDLCLRESCPGGDGTCSLKLTQTQLQRQTQVASHEFSEMVTDPEISAWRDPGNGLENGDVCNGRSGAIAVAGRSWNVQQMYSRLADVEGAAACILAPPAPLPSLLHWEEWDDNPASVQIAAANDHLYQRHNTGRIWRYTGTPMTGWQELDNNPATVAIVAANDHLYQLHNTGKIWHLHRARR